MAVVGRPVPGPTRAFSGGSRAACRAWNAERLHLIPGEASVSSQPSPRFSSPATSGAQRDEAQDHLEGLQSVLLHLEEKAGTMPRVMLHDLPSEGAPVVKRRQREAGAGASAFHQYQILGEVARGGVGIVYKARDFDIGRDVAIKMLKAELAEDPVRVQRFLEEAQVAGQLQHPGILPVYAVGLRNKETPYFTMKLIKGGTLAAALENRPNPTVGRQRLLDIFAHVTDAMAYAHARGVVHRDLKPANVLVGAYGEVQVMDWGMAKVLERGGVADELRAKQSQESVISIIEPMRNSDVGTDSIVGSVMGTPAYMAPEQAQGQVASIDARTDVFALGGILCEILTGAPPYRSHPEHSIIAQAARCMLRDAHERLDACGADAQLVELTKSCLVPAIRARPRDAGVLSKELEAYVRAVEERARQSQLDAVTAREREKAAEVRARASKRVADEERRAKRLTMGLAVAVLGIVLLGVGGWIWVQVDQRHRTASTEQAVSRHLDEALALLADAQADPDRAAAWEAALGAAQKAEAAVKAGDAPPATALRVASVLDRIQTGEAKAQEVAAAQARDATLVAALEDLTSRKGPEFDPALLEAGYAQAYEEYGLDVDGTPVAELVRQVQEARILDALVAGLDDWAWLRTRYALGRDATRDRPGEVARLADSDAWRNRVRDAARFGDSSNLKRLAKSADVATMQVGTVHLLASALDNAGDREGAVAFLRQAVATHPADFWSNLHLAYWLAGKQEPEWAEAVRYYTAAIALRPQSARLLNNLGIALQESKQLDAAIDAYDRALAIDPTLATAWNNLGTARLERGSFDPAIAAFDEAIRRQAEPAAALYGKGNALLKKGDAPGAIQAFQSALKVKADFPRARQQLFAALAEDGRQGEAVRMAEAALRDHPKTSWAQCQLAHALLRQGAYEKSIEAFERAIQLGDEDGVATHDLGSAYAQLGMWDRARACYAKAVALAPDDVQFHFDLGWAEKNWGAWSDALHRFQDTIDLDATYAPAYDERGELFLWMGRHGEAEAEFLRALEHAPDALYAHSHLGMLYGIDMPVEQAVARYEEHAKERTTGGRAAFFHGLSNSLYNRGALPEAYQAIKSALRAAPDAEVYHQHLGRILGYQLPFAAAVRRYEATAPGRIPGTEAYFYNGLGMSYSTRGLQADAAQAYAAARERSPKNAVPPANLAQTLDPELERERVLDLLQESLAHSPYYVRAHQQLGVVLGKTLDPGQAEVAYRERAVEVPGNCRAYFLLGLGTSLYARGSVEAAIDVWDEAMTLNQMVAATSGVSVAAAYLYDYGDEGRARDLLVQALTFAPRYDSASQFLGLLLGIEHEPSEAIAAYEKLVPQRPGTNEASFLVGLARAQVGHGNLDGALGLVQRALRLQPKHMNAHALHVQVLTQMGRTEEAVQVANGYLSTSPYETVVRNQLARAHWLAGNPAAALTALDAALEHAAGAPELLRMRGYLLERDGRWSEALEVYERAAQRAVGVRNWDSRKRLERALERAKQLAPLARKARAIADRDGDLAGLEPLDLAHLCLRCGASKRAAELFWSELRDAPDSSVDATDETLRTAACAAVAAGLGRGHDARRLKPTEREDWRDRAAIWLRRELARLRAIRSSSDYRVRAAAVEALREMLREPELASVRDEAALAHLPEDEAEGWRRLWADVRRASEPLALSGLTR